LDGLLGTSKCKFFVWLQIELLNYQGEDRELATAAVLHSEQRCTFLLNATLHALGWLIGVAKA